MEQNGDFLVNDNGVSLPDYFADDEVELEDALAILSKLVSDHVDAIHEEFGVRVTMIAPWQKEMEITVEL